jgi:hypothetical protein
VRAEDTEVILVRACPNRGRGRDHSWRCFADVSVPEPVDSCVSFPFLIESTPYLRHGIRTRSFGFSINIWIQCKEESRFIHRRSPLDFYRPRGIRPTCINSLAWAVYVRDLFLLEGPLEGQGVCRCHPALRKQSLSREARTLRGLIRTAAKCPVARGFAL